MIVKQPKFIFTSNEFLFNEFFKFYTVECLKIIIQNILLVNMVQNMVALKNNLIPIEEHIHLIVLLLGDGKIILNINHLEF